MTNPLLFLEEFISIVGSENVITTEPELGLFAADATENLFYLPELVLLPSTTNEVSEILKICNLNKIIITARGAGTGLAGGALAHRGGIVLSTKRMNKIIHIDEKNFQVVTQPGVITQELQDTLKAKGLFYPPDPSSRGSCFIGGNVAHNSGGPRAVKYGVVKDYVMNLEVVLANGSIINTGANVLKNSTGYNLTQLMVGSEGTLGIVTQITLKLIPHPLHDVLILVPFYNLENASEAVSAIFMAGFTPSALELIEIDALKIVSDYVNNTVIPIDDTIAAHLLIELDGNDPDLLMNQMELICETLQNYNIGEILFAADENQKSTLWQMRRKVAEAVKLQGFTIEEDTVVPRASMPLLIKGAKQIGLDYDCQIVCYGHAGDGNLHIRIRKEGHPYSLHNEAIVPALKQLFILVKSLGGTISGEHGIGLIQKEYMSIMFSEFQISLFKQIKNVFDPNNILNPGKIF